MSKTENVRDKILDLPKGAIIRHEYKPNVIHDKGMCDVVVLDDSINQYLEPSVTDKEAYRVSLASMRSDIARLSGSSSSGVYAFKDGVYDGSLDFSYLNRPDLTIVDITNYINHFKDNLDNYNEEMKIQISKELDRADQLLKQKQSVSKDNSSSSSE